MKQIFTTQIALSAGKEFNDFWESRGLTLQEVFANEAGYENINDISLETLNAPDKVFSIYRIVSNKFFTGINNGFRDGASAARQHNMLDEEGVFSRI